MRQASEASVEEILESIKKVIARDNRADAATARQRRETAGVVERAPEPVDEDEADEILDLGEAGFVAAEDYEEEDSDETLTNAASRKAMRDNLAALAMLAEPGAQPQIVRSGETSLEGMARDMLRPMLAEWLDANLPGMVEQMVRDEIARIAGKKG
uniref:DUF2497 domain-containing protein n=1 Tax=Parerythrobacter lutipelagi TaxID=1964208 RepID=UPI0010F7F65C|nr:DUF2497 domain-containing protein [Parerythrobacter lutipelagi]